MISALFYDIDDTLLDFKRAEDKAIRRTFCEIGIAPTDENARLYSEINDGFWKRLERGEVTREELLVARFSVLFDTLGITADAQAAQDFYFSRMAHEHDWLEGARETLDALVGRIPLYAVSNGTTVIQQKRIADSGLDGYFDGIFLSQQIGAQKPDAAFFDACFAALPALRREEVMIVGDSLTSDMLGGVNAGLVTCWYNPARKENTLGIRIDCEIRTPGEILTILDL